MQLTNKDVAGIPRTPWFPSNMKPARPGVYQVRPLNAVGERFALWTGEYWSVSSISADRARRFRIRSSHQHRVWRGLARDPHAEGQHRKERGIARALEHAGDDWKHAALNKVREWAAGPGRRCKGGAFAFEDVRAWAIEQELAPPPDHHAWGGIALAATRLGLIVFTGQYRPAAAPRTHGHCVRLYTVGGSA